MKVDDRNEKMGYKIREAQTQKVPYTVVVGDDELASASVSVRRYGEQDSMSQSVNMFISAIAADVANYSRTDARANN